MAHTTKVPNTVRCECEMTKSVKWVGCCSERSASSEPWKQPTRYMIEPTIRNFAGRLRENSPQRPLAAPLDRHQELDGEQHEGQERHDHVDQRQLARLPATVPAEPEHDDHDREVQVPHPEEAETPALLPEPDAREARDDVEAKADEERREGAPDHPVDVHGPEPSEGEPGGVAEEVRIVELGGDEHADRGKEQQPAEPGCKPLPDQVDVHQRVVLLRRAGERRRSEEHTSELQSRENLVCRLLLEKKKKEKIRQTI